MSSMWAMGCKLMIVWVLSDLTWLPLLGGGRKSFLYYIVDIIIKIITKVSGAGPCKWELVKQIIAGCRNTIIPAIILQIACATLQVLWSTYKILRNSSRKPSFMRPLKPPWTHLNNIYSIVVHKYFYHNHSWWTIFENYHYLRYV